MYSIKGTKKVSAIFAIVLSATMVLAMIPAMGVAADFIDDGTGGDEAISSEGDYAVTEVEVNAGISEVIDASVPDNLDYGNSLGKGDTDVSPDNTNWNLVINDTTTVPTNLNVKIENTTGYSGAGLIHEQGDNLSNQGSVQMDTINVDTSDSTITSNSDPVTSGTVNIASKSDIPLLENINVPSSGTDIQMSLSPQLQVPSDAVAGSYGGTFRIELVNVNYSGTVS